MSEKNEEPKEVGRKKISSHRRKNVSKRAIKGKLIVVKKFCPMCGHNKCFETLPIGGEGKGITKCTRCGNRYY